MEITPFNLSLPAETIDSLLLWLDDKQGIIIKQTDLLSGTGQSTTATMTQKAITDALGTKADASNVYTKTQTNTLLNEKSDKSTTYTKTETDNLLNNKVDKVAGKGLSSNDYTDAEKAKLGALPTAAELDSELAAKQDKDTDAVAGNVAVMDGNGNSVDGGVVLTDLATKAEVDAVEQEVAQIAGEAGLAEAVIDTDGAGTEQEFTFRKSGGDGGAYYRKIKGKTIVEDAQLASNDAEAVETTGVNQWDEEWRNGYYDADGVFHSYSTFLANKNPIHVIAGQQYYFRSTFSIAGSINIHGYDSLGNHLNVISITNRIFTIPDNVAYINWFVSVVATNTNDICINLSNPAINGQYFPYWKRTLQLGLTTRKDTDGNVPFADGMKGAGTAADWADKVGGEKIMGRVDLGTLNWIAYSVNIFSADISDKKNAASSSIVDNIICSKYPTESGDSVINRTVDKAIGASIANGRIFVYDTAYTDVATFKTAMQGVPLDFELATPVPFTWAEPLNLGVKVDENGTERAVAPEGATAPSAPFVADTTYTMSVARMVEILKNL